MDLLVGLIVQPEHRLVSEFGMDCREEILLIGRNRDKDVSKGNVCRTLEDRLKRWSFHGTYFEKSFEVCLNSMHGGLKIT